MIWVVQNQEIVPPGRYATLLHEQGVTFCVCRPDTGEALPRLSHGDGVVVLGGTMGTCEGDRYPWLAPLRDWMGGAVATDVPLLGICLGAQLLAEALDGTVTPRSHGERGVCRVELTEAGADDPLFSGIPATFSTLQWHNDSFDLPPGALHLAGSSACPVQAFRQRRAYALQFHPEVDVAVVSGWNALLKTPGDHPETFREAARSWQPCWDRLFLNFLAFSDP